MKLKTYLVLIHPFSVGYSATAMRMGSYIDIAGEIFYRVAGLCHIWQVVVSKRKLSWGHREFTFLISGQDLGPNIQVCAVHPEVGHRS